MRYGSRVHSCPRPIFPLSPAPPPLNTAPQYGVVYSSHHVERQANLKPIDVLLELAKLSADTKVINQSAYHATRLCVCVWCMWVFTTTGREKMATDSCEHGTVALPRTIGHTVI